MTDTKIIFIDIDGTLVNSKKEVSNYTRDVLSKINKYKILTSGRSCESTIKFSKYVNASNIIICCNGALVYDYDNDIIIYQNKVDKTYIKDIWNLCLENNMGCILNSLNKRYINKYVKKYSLDTDQIIDNIDSIDNVYQIVVTSLKYDQIDNLKEDISHLENIKISNYASYFIDITNKDVNKGVAVKELLNYLNISSDEAMCFGDGVNDIEMFNNCKYKVAMSNSRKEIIELSNYQTLSNDEDGVAKFLSTVKE